MMYGDMVASEETLLQQVVEMIVREVSPEAIILFGSVREVMRVPIPTLICSWLKRSRFRPSAVVEKKRRACIWR